ncbi:hypothetical protein PR048_008674 [Dryococelus australis]|uniref:Uncharacterized protein n=1 Tax=Dryococelus australis TaxID=614101 RepID=A0ABQ9HYS0_9NEOP|nr:hypothetical protein PR048_008674 [Dryococelus australis]
MQHNELYILQFDSGISRKERHFGSLPVEYSARVEGQAEETEDQRSAIVLCCVLAAALAAPQAPLLKLNPNEPIPIVAQSSVQNEDGSFQNSYESADGTKVDAAGLQKAVGPKGEAGTAIQGAYSFYIDNVLYTLTYVADENGFQPQANYLPTPPPIPEKILEALAYNAAHPEEDNLKRK